MEHIKLRLDRGDVLVTGDYRPGYADSGDLAPEDASILHSAEVLNQALSQLWAEHGGRAGDIVVIGHSIGAAVTVLLAGMALARHRHLRRRQPVARGGDGAVEIAAAATQDPDARRTQGPAHVWPRGLVLTRSPCQRPRGRRHHAPTGVAGHRLPVAGPVQGGHRTCGGARALPTTRVRPSVDGGQSTGPGLPKPLHTGTGRGCPAAPGERALHRFPPTRLCVSTGATGLCDAL